MMPVTYKLENQVEPLSENGTTLNEWGRGLGFFQWGRAEMCVMSALESKQED